MKIASTNGFGITVDAKVYNRTSKYQWHVSRSRNGQPSGVYRWYIIKGLRCWDKSSGRFRDRRVRVVLARQIMGLHNEDGMIVDHINRNALDNRRSNLRICTFQQNIQNSSSSRGKFKYKGVARRPAQYKKKRYIAVCNRKSSRGFETLTEAAKEYDRMATEMFGEYACLNFPK